MCFPRSKIFFEIKSNAVVYKKTSQALKKEKVKRGLENLPLSKRFRREKQRNKVI